jgi:hypothetical protein
VKCPLNELPLAQVNGESESTSPLLAMATAFTIPLEIPVRNVVDVTVRERPMQMMSFVCCN